MRFSPTVLPEVLIVEPVVYGDDRGFFFESYNRRRFEEAVGTTVEFVQDNHSRSARHVLRGLHYQFPPNAQGKLVRVGRGAIFDVAVDMRQGSPTFGSWAGVELSDENRRQLWIPVGFAHGFLTLSDTADVLYKASGYYSPPDEGSVAWDDPDLAIRWPIGGEPLLSDKDRAAPRLSAAKAF